MTERTGHTPDPADPEGLRYAVKQQGIALGRQADALSQVASAQQELFQRLDGLTQSLMDLTGQMAPPAAPLSASGVAAVSASVPTPENFRLQPEPFHGDVEACGGFLLQCRLLFQQAPRYYNSDLSKITLIINSLRYKALQWAQAFLTTNPVTHLSYEHFIEEFKLVFDQPRKQEEAARKLLALRQRNRSVSDHVIDFRILAVEAGWTDPVLRGVFYQSLSETIKDHLCSQPETHSFEELVTAALRSDTRLRERQHERPSPTRRTSTTPMQDFPVPSYPKRRNVQKREDNKVSSEEDSEDEKYYPVPLEPGETYCDQSELTPEVCDPTHENSEHIHQTGNTLPVLEEEPERAGGTQHCSDTEDSIASPPALIDCGEERHQRPQRSHRRPKVFTYDTLGTPACYKIGTHSYYMDWNMPQLNTVPTYYQLTPYGY
ncbi:uncharacterized protein LOC144983742 isoform X2 [Oryzias latipes]